MPGPIYRKPDKDLSQGDVLDQVPQIHLKFPIQVIRQVTLPGGKIAWTPFPYPPEEGNTPDVKRQGSKYVGEPFHLARGETVPSLAQFTRAILLNYDCDLEHEPDHCLVAIVRPMTGVPEASQPIIRENRNYSYFHLPATQEFELEEGYVDFRRVTCLHPDLLENLGKRKASLSPEAVHALQRSFIRFVTRRDLSQ